MFKDYGKHLGIALFDKNANFDKTEAAVTTLEKDYKEVSKFVYKFASACMELAKDTNCVEYQYLKQLEQQEHWYPELNESTNIILDVLSKSAFIKKAKPAIDAKKIFGAVGSGLSDVGYGALMAALITGSFGGGSIWLLNQDIQSDEAENEILEAKRKEYETLSKQIKDKIKQRYYSDFNEEVDND